MKQHYKNAIDQVKADPALLEQISAKIEQNNKRKFWNKRYAKFAFVASIIIVIFTGVVVMKSSQWEVATTGTKQVENKEIAVADQTASGAEETDQFDTVATEGSADASAEIYMTVGGAEGSYAIDPMDYEVLKETADYVFTFEMIEEVGIGQDERGFIYTTYHVEIINVIKGEVSGTVPIQIPGGSITVEEYCNTVRHASVSEEFPDGIEGIEDQLIVSDPSWSVSIVPDQEYLVAAYYDEASGAYKVVCDVYGIYTVNGDQAVNQATGNTIQESEF